MGISFENGTKIIAVCNQKGGVGKTTLSVNLAYALSQLGRDVLLVDFDSQASATALVNVDWDDSFYGSIYELLHFQMDGTTFVDEWDQDPDMNFKKLCSKCILRPTYTDIEFIEDNDGKKTMMEVSKEFGFDILSSKIELSDLELEYTMEKSGQAYHLRNLLKQIQDDYHKYDYVIIDCNPSLGVMSLNAMVAATTGILVSCNMSLLAMRGIQQLTDRIVDVQISLKQKDIIHMGVVGIMFNLFNPRGQVDNNLKIEASTFLPYKTFDTVIPRSVEAEKALYARQLFSQLSSKAYDAFRSLANEMEEQIAAMEEKGQIIKRMGEIEEDENEQAE